MLDCLLDGKGLVSQGSHRCAGVAARDRQRGGAILLWLCYRLAHTACEGGNLPPHPEAGEGVRATAVLI